MTDPRQRAWRALGKVQRFVPDAHICTLRAALAAEIASALDEAGVPTAVTDPYRKEFLDALSVCQDIVLQIDLDNEEVMLRCKQTLTRFFRGVGK